MTKISSSSWDMEGPWRIYEHLDASWCFMMLHGLWCCISLINFESVWIFLPISTGEYHWAQPWCMPEPPFYKVFSRSRKHHFQPHSPYARRDSDVTGRWDAAEVHKKDPPEAAADSSRLAEVTGRPGRPPSCCHSQKGADGAVFFGLETFLKLETHRSLLQAVLGR